jgi:hypothetical protein
MQAASATLGRDTTLPHVPQLLVSVFRLISQPSLSTPLQSVYLRASITNRNELVPSQLDVDAIEAIAYGGWCARHGTRSHMPTAEQAMFTVTHPGAHLLMVQVALEQETSMTLDRELGAGHDAPQAPQLALSVRRSIQALPPQCMQQTPFEQV